MKRSERRARAYAARIAKKQMQAAEKFAGRGMICLRDPPGTCTCHRGRCGVHAEEKRGDAKMRRLLRFSTRVTVERAHEFRGLSTRVHPPTPERPRGHRKVSAANIRAHLAKRRRERELRQHAVEARARLERQLRKNPNGRVAQRLGVAK